MMAANPTGGKQMKKHQPSEMPVRTLRDGSRAAIIARKNESPSGRLMTEQPVRRATGPRTEPGEQRSRYNATKHGIFHIEVIPGRESLAEYHAPVN